MTRQHCVAFVAVVAAVAVAHGASGKDFEPGDLRLCGSKRCVAITNVSALKSLSAFYYGGRAPGRASRPRLGEPYVELRFDNGYVTGIAATPKLNRFLSYGVNLGRFTRGRWYAVPPAAAHELRKLGGTRVTPFFLSRAALARSR